MTDMTVHLRLFIIAFISIIATTTFAQDTGVKFATATPHPTATPTASPTPSPSPTATFTATSIPEAYVEPTTIVVQAEDGVFLVGDFYLFDSASPTIVLFHQLYTNRYSWDDVIGSLMGAHYNVLRVDLRGQGDSGSSINWRKAITDVAVWFDWLRTDGGVRADAISTMGSSMGSTVAIVGCANDAYCKTAIAISPGWDYYGIEIKEALTEGFRNRGLLIFYAERDRWPAVGMPLIEEAATGTLSVQVLPANTHGMDMFKLHQNDMLAAILDWLTLHGV